MIVMAAAVVVIMIRVRVKVTSTSSCSRWMPPRPSKKKRQAFEQVECTVQTLVPSGGRGPACLGERGHFRPGGAGVDV